MIGFPGVLGAGLSAPPLEHGASGPRQTSEIKSADFSGTHVRDAHRELTGTVREERGDRC